MVCNGFRFSKTADSSIQKAAQNIASTQGSHRSVSHRLLALQWIIGNRCIVELFASGKVQTKLTIGEPDDKYEDEADQVADQVMRMPDTEIGRNSIDHASLQGKAATVPSIPLNHPISDSVQEHVEKQAVHAKQLINRQPARPYVEAKIDSLKGGILCRNPHAIFLSQD